MNRQDYEIVYISSCGTLEHIHAYQTTKQNLASYIAKKIELGVKADQIMAIPTLPQKR